MQYKYSLHLQFIKPILSNTHGNPKFVDNHRMLSSHKKVNVICEKCNYTHLVHCPISDLSCDTERKRYKTLNLNNSFKHIIIAFKISFILQGKVN